MGERQGKLVWHEVMTPDPKKAIDFYTKLIGWTVTEFPSPSGEPYWVLNNGKDGVAGVMKMPKGVQAPPHWMLYVLSENVDADHAKALKLGAQSHVKPTDIPTVGRFAVMMDPQGAAFAMLQPESPEYRKDEPAKVGEFSWHELTSDDAKAGLDFYQQLFGWEKRDGMDMGPMGTYQLWSRKGNAFDLGGMMNRAKDMPPSSRTNYIKVKSVDDSAPKLKELGGKVMVGPMDVPGGDRVLIGTDNGGAIFALHSSKG